MLLVGTRGFWIVMNRHESRHSMSFFQKIRYSQNAIDIFSVCLHQLTYYVNHSLCVNWFIILFLPQFPFLAVAVAPLSQPLHFWMTLNESLIIWEGTKHPFLLFKQFRNFLSQVLSKCLQSWNSVPCDLPVVIQKSFSIDTWSWSRHQPNPKLSTRSQVGGKIISRAAFLSRCLQVFLTKSCGKAH